jgi:hypothetical protein
MIDEFTNEREAQNRTRVGTAARASTFEIEYRGIAVLYIFDSTKLY